MINLIRVSKTRVKSRPANIYLQRIRDIRLLLLFSVKFLKDCSLDSLLININESFLNHNIKINYSWEATLKLMEAKDQVFTESISIFFWRFDLINPGFDFWIKSRLIPIILLGSLKKWKAG